MLLPEGPITSLHHALIVPLSPTNMRELAVELAARGVDASSLYHFRAERLDAEAFEKIVPHLHAAQGLSRRVCLIETGMIQKEVQQKLLKYIEEPRGGLLMIIAVPYPQGLLLTIRSRAHILARGAPRTADMRTLAESFAHIKDISEEKNTQAGIEYLDGLEVMSDRREGVLTALYRAKDSLLKGGISQKQVLEMATVVALLPHK